MEMFEVYQKHRVMFEDIGITPEQWEKSGREIIAAGFMKIDDNGNLIITMPDTGAVVGHIPV